MSHLKLVPLVRELEFDNTMKEVLAVLRMDAKMEENIKVQLLIDFRHKMDKKRSKPRFYGTMSQSRQFTDLVCMSLAMATFHRLRKKEEVTKEEITKEVDEVISWIKEDTVTLTKLLMKDIEKWREENANQS